jgi:hypothetical protein
MHGDEERVVHAIEFDRFSVRGVDDAGMSEDLGWVAADHRGLIEAPYLCLRSGCGGNLGDCAQDCDQ